MNNVKMLLLFGSNRLALLVGLGLAALGLAVPSARAGLNFEMNVIRYHQYGFYFYPNVTTNDAGPTLPFGDYEFASKNAPTNGSSVLYRFTTNGFTQMGGVNWGYNNFDTMLNELTNGLWSVYVTNTVTTNVYHFGVTADITSNALPLVTITFPSDGAVNVTNQPTFTWQGPTNYSNLVVYYFNRGDTLPVTQTSLMSPIVFYQGINNFTAHYDDYSALAVVASVPTNSAAQPIAFWRSTVHFQDYAGVQFTVGTVDPLGTAHTLVAHYPWDGINENSTASGADTSGNGYNMDFSDRFGAQGGTDSSADPAAGPLGIQFHNGDDNSAGYVGWYATPPALLSALSGSFSVSCWIKTTQLGAGGWDDAPAYYGAGIVSADNGGLANDVIPLALTGSRIGFNTGGDVEDVTLNSSASVNDGSYHHVVVTRNQVTGQKIIYIDGVLDSFSSGTTNLLNSPQLLTIGALSDANESDASSTFYYNGYDGLVDDLQIYSGVLSSNAVAQLYANPGSTIPNNGGPGGGHQNVAHYTFDNTASTFALAFDSSPHGNHLGSYTYWGDVHTNNTDDVVGGGAAQFFGTSDMTAIDQTLTNLNAVLAGSFSFSVWVKTTVTNGADYNNAFFGAVIFWAYNDHGNTNDTIPLSITGSKVAFTTRDHLGNYDTLHSFSSVNDGNYHMITVTRDQDTGQKKIYVDGNFETSEIGTTEPLNGNNYDLTVGGFPYYIDGTGTNFSSYKGLLDDLQVYAGVLSASDVAYLYSHPGAIVVDTTGPDFNAALDTTGLTWTTGGDAPWFVETTNTHDNVSAAQSGHIGGNGQTWLETTVTGPGTLSFWWQVLSEEYVDYLEFLIDGSWQTDMSGDYGWQYQEYSIDPGPHTLRWNYYKDDTDDEGLDAGFLDEVSYIPDVVTPPSPVTLLNPSGVGDGLTFQFLSQAGFTHTIEARPNVDSGTWVTLTNVPGDGTMKLIQIPGTNQPTRFFRVGTQ